MAKTVDHLTKAINAKLQTLKLTQGQAITAFGNKAVISMARIQNTLKKKVEEVHDLKTEIQELMFEAEKEEHEIVKQSTEIEERVSVFEATIDQLDVTIKECKRVEAQTEEKEKEEHDAQLREKKYDEEMRFEKAKLEQKQKYEKKIEEKKEQNINTKLPKLVITQFKGTPTDWLRFWGQFTAEIDAADISQITKFSYLKELLEPQVRPSIDGLPLTTEDSNCLRCVRPSERESTIPQRLPRDWATIAKQTLERTREKPVPTCGPSRGPEASFSTSENPRGRQRRDAISLAQGPRHQTRGNFTLHTSTVRLVHVAILAWGSD